MKYFPLWINTHFTRYSMYSSKMVYVGLTLKQLQ